ncbi:hypothetical protein HOD29_04945 [archaeon]|jgi:hypothetical protein|nr:hypothetical protein [archaeon]
MKKLTILIIAIILGMNAFSQFSGEIFKGDYYLQNGKMEIQKLQFPMKIIKLEEVGKNPLEYSILELSFTKEEGEVVVVNHQTKNFFVVYEGEGKFTQEKLEDYFLLRVYNEGKGFHGKIKGKLEGNAIYLSKNVMGDIIYWAFSILLIFAASFIFLFRRNRKKWK